MEKQYETEKRRQNIGIDLSVCQCNSVQQCDVGCRCTHTHAHSSSRKRSCLCWRQTHRPDLICKSPFLLSAKIWIVSLCTLLPLWCCFVMMFIHITLATDRECTWFQKQKNVCPVFLMIFFFCNVLVFRLLHHPLWCLLFSAFLQHRGSLYLTRAKLALLWFYPPTLPLGITSTWKVTSDSQRPIMHLTRRRMAGTHIYTLRKALRAKMCLRCPKLWWTLFW